MKWFTSRQTDNSGSVPTELDKHIRKLCREADATQQSLIVLDRCAIVRYINDALLERWPMGYDILGECLWDALPDVAQTEGGRETRAALSSWQPRRYRTMSRTSRTWYEVQATPHDELMVFSFAPAEP